jgi:hypothetical protein
MQRAAGLFLLFGILIFTGKAQGPKAACANPMRLTADRATVYLEYLRDVDTGHAYRIALQNNVNAPISVNTPCAECKHFPCQAESAPVFQPYYQVGEITGDILVPNRGGDVVCDRSIAPGESAEFTVPKKYLPRNSAIFLPFEYEWEGGKANYPNNVRNEPLHYLQLSGPNSTSEVPY